MGILGVAVVITSIYLGYGLIVAPIMILAFIVFTSWG